MRVTFAASRSGRSYFERFLSNLSIQDRAVILAVFQDIQSHGLLAKGGDFRQIERKLWEIRVRAPNGGYRFFYMLLNENHMHIVHSYKKQSQKAPAHEIELAKNRAREVLHEK